MTLVSIHTIKDLKYLAALTIPISAIIALYFQGVWSYLTPIYAFGVIPILELLLPKSNTNYSEKVQVKRRVNMLFDWLLYLNIPIVFGLLFIALFIITNGNLESYEFLGLALSVGMVLGTNGINVGHELGHRHSTNERFLGKLLLLPALYMHFYIEHNFGHHLHVATKEDPATAKYNQHVYSFWIASVFKQYVNAWRIQLNLLKKDRLKFFSLKNDMLWYLLFQASFLIAVYLFFGKIGLLFCILSSITGILLLETVNYIEHYGLKRQKTSSGRYERVKQIHSWNSNHIVGRIVLYELTRHSDHHFKSSKKYQTLECHDESPQMPFGYPTSMVLALLPPLWFKIMNKRIPQEMITSQS
jgi:alkane 1-monooxygenase